MKTITIEPGDTFGYISGWATLHLHRRGQYQMLAEKPGSWEPLMGSEVFTSVPDSVAHAVLAATGYTIVHAKPEPVKGPVPIIKCAMCGRESIISETLNGGPDASRWQRQEEINKAVGELARALKAWHNPDVSLVAIQLKEAAQSVIDAGGKAL
jgi:hypothetical protein